MHRVTKFNILQKKDSQINRLQCLKDIVTLAHLFFKYCILSPIKRKREKGEESGVRIHCREWEPVLPFLDCVLPSFRYGYYFSVG
jgi:hypothetical protein